MDLVHRSRRPADPHGSARRNRTRHADRITEQFGNAGETGYGTVNDPTRKDLTTHRLLPRGEGRAQNGRHELRAAEFLRMQTES